MLLGLVYSETSLIRHSMGPENNAKLGGCHVTGCLLAYFNMVTVPHKMVGLARMSDYRGVRLLRSHCTTGGVMLPVFPDSYFKGNCVCSNFS